MSSSKSVNKVRNSQHSISREEDQSKMIEGSMGHIDGLIPPVLLGLPPCQRGKVRCQQPSKSLCVNYWNYLHTAEEP